MSSLTLPFAGKLPPTPGPPPALGVFSITSTNGHVGVAGEAIGNPASLSLAHTKAGVLGKTDDGYGVVGESNIGTGVYAFSSVSHGVQGINGGTSGLVPDRGIGVWGDSVNGVGVLGTSKFIGVVGEGAYLAARFVGDVQVTGDLCLVNQDCAEDFDISCVGEIEPGTVMVIEKDGALHMSERAYDKRVAGVISGAGSFKPGIVLGRQKSDDKRMPIALLGKVYCKVDASSSPIEVGDLLTTSLTPGYAMRATDPLRSFGAVIGKALRPLENGVGLIPILIALQ